MFWRAEFCPQEHWPCDKTPTSMFNQALIDWRERKNTSTTISVQTNRRTFSASLFTCLKFPSFQTTMRSFSKVLLKFKFYLRIFYNYLELLNYIWYISPAVFYHKILKANEPSLLYHLWSSIRQNLFFLLITYKLCNKMWKHLDCYLTSALFVIG